MLLWLFLNLQNKGIVPLAVTFCKGPEFVRSLENLLHQASKNVSPP